MLLHPHVSVIILSHNGVDTSTFSLGLPVIATNILGMDKVTLEGDNGFLVMSNDIKASHSKMQVLAEDTAPRKKMGMNAQRVVKMKFSWRFVARKTVNVYERLSKGGPKS